MKDILVGVCEGHSKENFAESHSVDVDEILTGLIKQTEIPSVDGILEVLEDLKYTPRLIKVPPSQISSSPLGAAAGVQSIVSDWLKFSLKYLEVHALSRRNRTKNAAQDRPSSPPAPARIRQRPFLGEQGLVFLPGPASGVLRQVDGCLVPRGEYERRDILLLPLSGDQDRCCRPLQYTWLLSRHGKPKLYTPR